MRFIVVVVIAIVHLSTPPDISVLKRCTKSSNQLKSNRDNDARDLARAPYNIKDAQCAAHVFLPGCLSAVVILSSPSLSRSSSRCHLRPSLHTD